MSSLCINCHSQLQQNQGILGTKIAKMKENDFDNIFSYAEFLYLIRDYEKSILFYKKAISERIEKNLKLQTIKKNALLPEKDIRQSLLRVLSIYTKIQFLPQKALDFLKDYKSASLSSDLKDDIKQWEEELVSWSKKEGAFNQLGVNHFIDTYLAPVHKETSFEDGEHYILLFLSSGILYHELQSPKKESDQAKILYWLGVIEGPLSHQLFYSLSDAYLKECIIKYPKSAYAKKCYQQYEDNIEFGYSGSSGLHIPKDVKQELLKLKKMIK